MPADTYVLKVASLAKTLARLAACVSLEAALSSSRNWASIGSEMA